MRITFSSLLAGLFLSASLSVMAVPAKPGLLKITQPDGSVIEAEITGDEHFRFYRTSCGEILLEGPDGFLCRAAVDDSGELVTAGRPVGTATPESDARAIRAAAGARRMAKMTEAASPRRIAPGRIQNSFPTTGEVKGLIIMAEFEDVKFSPGATPQLYDRKVNEAGYSDESTFGSVYDYFVTQSSGVFTPKFDIVGPVTLPHPRKWYGEGAEERLDDLFRDACTLADEAGTDFTQYDVNNDLFVDFVFVIFAGHGEAQGGPQECVWPAMKNLENSVYDYFDNMNLGVAACSCELKGGEGEELDGIGTICHEFSHILGLADIYDTSYQGGHGMGHFDIMDMGSYNDNQVTPAGYTAMDRYTLGWMEPSVLDETVSGVELENIVTSNKAYFIVNPENENEYFTLENRQQEGWDKGLPYHGLVVSYVHYEPTHWRRNTVNSPMAAIYEHVRIVAADNTWSKVGNSEQGDPFPGIKEVTEFTAAGSQAHRWQSTKKVPEFTVTDIAEKNGGITFNFSASSSGLSDIFAGDATLVNVSGNDIIAPAGSEVYDLAGRRVGLNSLPAGIYIVRTPSATVKVAVK